MATDPLDFLNESDARNPRQSQPPPLPPTQNQPNQASSPREPVALWDRWDAGAKTMVVAACVALLSMFMSWIDIMPVSRNGFEQESFAYLGIFIYPAFMLVRQRRVNTWGGIGCGIAGVLLVARYIATVIGHDKTGLFFAVGTGAYVFLVASVALIVGSAIQRAPRQPL